MGAVVIGEGFESSLHLADSQSVQWALPLYYPMLWDGSASLCSYGNFTLRNASDHAAYRGGPGPYQ